MGLLKLGIRFFSNNFKPDIMKYLNVAEKNDAAKNIAAILSRGASTRVNTLDINVDFMEYEQLIYF